MCNIEITMPVVTTFLFTYDLRAGSVVILLYTSVRVIFFIVFTIAVFLEVLINHQDISPLILKSLPPTADIVTVYYVFFCYLSLIIAEFFLLVFLLHLYFGVMHEKCEHLEYYLLCRMMVWFIETTVLFMLSVKHVLLSSWYLFMLLLVFIDLYPFVVVYSYYVNLLMVEERKKAELLSNIPCSVQLIPP